MRREEWEVRFEEFEVWKVWRVWEIDRLRVTGLEVVGLIRIMKQNARKCLKINNCTYFSLIWEREVRRLRNYTESNVRYIMPWILIRQWREIIKARIRSDFKACDLEKLKYKDRNQYGPCLIRENETDIVKVIV